MTRRAALTLSGAALLVAALATLLLRSDELRYEGRTLEQWITASSHISEEREAYDAIVTITTNHAPALVRWLAYNLNPRLPSSLEAKLPRVIRQNQNFRHFIYRENARRRVECAIRAFEITGTNAMCAIPALEKLLSDQKKSNAGRTQALSTLGTTIGPAALPSIRHALTNPTPGIRTMAMVCLRRLGTNAAPAIPDLVSALSDQNVNVRRNATNALQALAPEALTNLPAK